MWVPALPLHGSSLSVVRRAGLQNLPAPFGLKVEVPKETTIQIVIIKNCKGETTILKHLAFPGKIEATFFKQLIYGEGFQYIVQDSKIEDIPEYSEFPYSI